MVNSCLVFSCPILALHVSRNDFQEDQCCSPLSDQAVVSQPAVSQTFLSALEHNETPQSLISSACMIHKNDNSVSFDLW